MRSYWLTGVALAAVLTFGGVAHAADIPMGVAGPLTGPNAAFGEQLQKGAQQAVDDINAAGGVLGQKIILEFGDDASDPKQGVSVANKFVGDGVKFVDGHFNSGVSIPASEVYSDNGILEITPAATNPKFTDRGLWDTFRTCGRDDQQGLVAGAYILDHYKGKNVAVLHDKTPYGQGLADATKGTINKGGLTETMYEGINVGDKDFSALISKMKQANIDLIYFGGLHTEAGAIVRQAADAGLKAQFMSGDGIVSSEFASEAGPAAEGVLNTFAPEPRDKPEAKEIVAKFRAAGYEPEAYTLYSYSAIQVLAAGITKAGSADDAQKVAEVLHKDGPWHTVLGDITFDAKGDLSKIDYVMYIWKKGADGKISYVEMK
jgi:branched-chain amino acid transport system substrate-binding protein